MRFFKKAEHNAIEKAVKELVPGYRDCDEKIVSIDLEEGKREEIVKLLDNALCPHIKMAFELLEKDPDAIADACEELEKSNHQNKDDAIALLNIDCLKINEKIKELKLKPKRKIACAQAEALAKNIPLNLKARSNNGEQGVDADPGHLMNLCNFDDLGLPPENIHIIGNSQNQGICFNLNDPILEVVQLDGNFDENNQERIQESIAKHFKEEYVDKNVAGAHHFLCNLSRPSKH